MRLINAWSELENEVRFYRDLQYSVMSSDIVIKNVLRLLAYLKKARKD